MTPADWDLVLKQGGPIAMFVIFIMGLIRGWWVMGNHFRDMAEDRDFWRQATLDGLDAAEKTLDLHEHAIQRRSP